MYGNRNFRSFQLFFIFSLQLCYFLIQQLCLFFVPYYAMNLISFNFSMYLSNLNMSMNLTNLNMSMIIIMLLNLCLFFFPYYAMYHMFNLFLFVIFVPQFNMNLIMCLICSMYLNMLICSMCFSYNQFNMFHIMLNVQLYFIFVNLQFDMCIINSTYFDMCYILCLFDIWFIISMYPQFDMYLLFVNNLYMCIITLNFTICFITFLMQLYFTHRISLHLYVIINIFSSFFGPVQAIDCIMRHSLLLTLNSLFIPAGIFLMAFGTKSCKYILSSILKSLSFGILFLFIISHLGLIIDSSITSCNNMYRISGNNMFIICIISCICLTSIRFNLISMIICVILFGLVVYRLLIIGMILYGTLTFDIILYGLFIFGTILYGLLISGLINMCRIIGIVFYGLWNTSSCNFMLKCNNKRIGIMYLLISILYSISGIIVSLIIRYELYNIGSRIITINNMFIYSVYITYHGIIMIFYFVMPALFGGYGNYLYPLCLGIIEVEYPRINILSLLLLILSFISFVFNIFSEYGSTTGWTIYPPLSTSLMNLSGLSLDFIIIGLITSGISSMLSSINYIVMFSMCIIIRSNLINLLLLSILITSYMLIIVLPIISGLLMLLLFDLNFNSCYFDPVFHGEVLYFEHLFWLFGHPEVYILILPAFGLISLIIMDLLSKLIFGIHSMIIAMINICLIGIIVWGHHMFSSGLFVDSLGYFMSLTIIISLPTGTKIFNWCSSIIFTYIFNLSMIFILIFNILFTLGGTTGVILGNSSVDVGLHDTYYVVAHFHLVLSIGALICIIGYMIHVIDIMLPYSLYYFMLLSKQFPSILYISIILIPLPISFIISLIVLLLLISICLIFIPMHLLGLNVIPRRTPDFNYYNYHTISTISSFILIFTYILPLIYKLFISPFGIILYRLINFDIIVHRTPQFDINLICVIYLPGLICLTLSGPINYLYMNSLGLISLSIFLVMIISIHINLYRFMLFGIISYYLFNLIGVILCVFLIWFLIHVNLYRLIIFDLIIYSLLIDLLPIFEVEQSSLCFPLVGTNRGIFGLFICWTKLSSYFRL